MDCNEVVYYWNGVPAYVCIAQRGTEHSHADPEPDNTRDFFESDTFILADIDCVYVNDGTRKGKPVDPVAFGREQQQEDN